MNGVNGVNGGNGGNVVNVAVVGVVEGADEALTLADLGTRDHHHLEDVRLIVRRLLVVKQTHTSQVAGPEGAIITVVGL